MAALPDNFTSRLFVDYTTGDQTTSQEHTFQIRGGGEGVTGDTLQDYAELFLLGVGAQNLRVGWRVLRARLQQANTSFSVPLTLTTGLDAFVGTNAGALAAQDEAREWAWEGRSFTSGRKVSVSLYGLVASTPPNFRLVAGGSSPAWVQASINALNNPSVPTNVGTTIDGTKPTWYGYINVQYNSYWERRIRSV